MTLGDREDLITKTIDSILQREGGFVDIPEDRGGATNRGITAVTLGAWRRLGRAATNTEVKALTEDEARIIYRTLYINRPGFEAIQGAALFGLLVDSGVNHGPKNAIKLLQRALGVKVDGVLGPVTIAAVNAMPTAWLYRKVLAERVRFYGRLISQDHTQAVFAAGWLNRVAEFVEV